MSTLEAQAVDHDPFAEGELASAAPPTAPLVELWSASRLSKESNLGFNEVVEVILDGDVDHDALRASMEEVFARHEALRGAFSPDGKYFLVAAEAKLPLREIDWSSEPESQRSEALVQLRRRLVETPFDLSAGPLFDLTWVHDVDGRQRIFIRAHHAVCDGWSFGVVVTELAELYKARVAGRPAELEAAPSFIDYLEHQTETEVSEATERDEKWWVEQLGVDPPVLDLPVDRDRQAFRGYRSRLWFQGFDPDLLKKLRAVGAKSGATIVATLETVFAIVMSRLANRNDFVLGMPLAGQPLQDQGGLVGHCVQTVPVRITLNEDTSFKDNVSRVKTRLFDAQDHANATFQRILQRLDLPFDPSRIPLIPVAFNVEPALQGVDFSPASARVELVPRTHENFELFLNIETDRNRAVLQWSYNTDLFDHETIRAWGELFVHVARQVVEDPDQPISGIEAVSPADRAVLDPLQPPPPPDRAETLLPLFDQIVEAHPDRLALTDGSTDITYRELDTESRRRAAGLAHLGVGRGDLVAVHAPRRAELVVDLLAILRAGAAYLPLDPTHPTARKQLILEVSRPRLVIGSNDSLPEGREVVEGSELARRGTDAPLPPRPSGDDLAYVIFTSGSTGTPKGVAIEHRAMTRLLTSMVDIVGIEPDDRMLAVTTITFDISVYELFAPLLAGATVYVASDADAKDPRRLRRLIEAPEMTLFDATPTTYRMLLDAGWTRSQHLRTIAAGEPLPRDLADAIRDRVEALFNGYGPTESTVFTTYERVPADGPVSIGGPLPHVALTVLDERLREVPVGAIGELFAGGGQLARGYLNDPARTSERFIVHPRDGRRLYRTGDLVRVARDGRLYYRGRTDFQVKVRGHRIELEEIEVALRAAPGVERATVVAANDELVAFVSGSAPAASSELRAHLASQLPTSMVPSRFEVLDELPTTTSGKVDRKALTRRARESRVEDAGPSRAPATDMERLLVEVWSSVLGRSVGPDDDFIEIGGHSLQAVAIVLELSQRLHREIEVMELIRYSRLSDLAVQLGGEPPSAPSSDAPAEPAVAEESTPILPSDSVVGSGRLRMDGVTELVRCDADAVPIFVVHDGDGATLPYLELARALSPSITVLTLQPESAPRVPMVNTTIEEMAAVYVDRIRSVQPNGPYFIGGLCAGGVIGLEMVRQLEAMGARVGGLVALDATIPWARQRKFLMSRNRLNRLGQALASVDGSLTERALAAVGVFAEKARGYSNWELQTRAADLVDRVRLELFKRSIGGDAPLHPLLEHIPVRTIYMAAEARYRPRGLISSPVFLVRATEGVDDADTPMKVWMVDPAFGWEHVTRGSVHTFDAEGGHSTMLQKPKVEGIARWLASQLGTTSR